MSIIRKVKIEVDEQTLRDTANELGCTVKTMGQGVFQISREGATLTFRSLAPSQGVHLADSVEQCEISYDRDYAQGLASSFVPTYQERLIERRTRRLNYKIVARTDTKQEIVLTLRR